MKRIHLITLLFLSQAFLFAHAETLKYSHPNKSQTTVSPTAPVSNKVQPNTASANTKDEKHEFVDLGLSVQWATTNIGSENPEDFGDFYAWGETTPKKVYNWENYKWAKGSETTLTKYCMIEEYGKKDLKFALDPEDDAATVNWGPDWHTPTTAEWKELINNCTWSKTRIDLMDGYKITGKNGNWIFLPEHGFCVDAKRKWESYYEMTLQDFLVGDLSDIDEEEMEELVEWGLLEDKKYYEAINTGLYYLSNTVNPLKPNNVMIMFAKSGEIKVAGIDRSYGYYVRPVRSNAVESVSLDKKSITLEVGDSETLSATVNPANATNKTLKWESSNPSVASVTDGRINAKSAGTATVTVKSSNGKSSTCTVTVKKKSPQYVDLGLSVKWATTNIGADNPEDSGDYFAWGETKPKRAYLYETYKYCISTRNKDKLTKYCYKRIDGYKLFRDNRLSLDPEDDAATANWGSDWRMPTKEELEELRTQCKWVWDEMNGKPGYKVIGKNGNMIFLPESGYIFGHKPNLSITSFWSRTISDIIPWAAVTINFYLNESSNKRMIVISNDFRQDGLTVRPVHP